MWCRWCLSKGCHSFQRVDQFFNALIKKKADTDINRFLLQTAQALLPAFRICNGLLCRLSSHGSAVLLLQLMLPMQRTLGGNERVPCCFQSPCPNATVLTLITSSQARQTRTIRHLQMMKRHVVRKVIQRHLLTSLRTVTVISKEDFVRFDECTQVTVFSMIEKKSFWTPS